MSFANSSTDALRDAIHNLGALREEIKEMSPRDPEALAAAIREGTRLLQDAVDANTASPETEIVRNPPHSHPYPCQV